MASLRTRDFNSEASLLPALLPMDLRWEFSDFYTPFLGFWSFLLFWYFYLFLFAKLFLIPEVCEIRHTVLYCISFSYCWILDSHFCWPFRTNFGWLRWKPFFLFALIFVFSTLTLVYLFVVGEKKGPRKKKKDLPLHTFSFSGTSASEDS